MMTREQIELCRRIGRDELNKNSTIALVELDALCDTALAALPEVVGDFQIAPDTSGPVAQGPDNICIECGALNQFIPVHYHEGDSDLECTQCGSKEFEEGYNSALMRVIEQRDKTQKMADGWESECRLAQRDLARVRAELSARRAKDHGEVWYWQGDSEDHLETLTCPVLIDPRVLSDLISATSA